MTKYLYERKYYDVGIENTNARGEYDFKFGQPKVNERKEFNTLEEAENYAKSEKERIKKNPGFKCYHEFNVYEIINDEYTRQPVYFKVYGKD